MPPHRVASHDQSGFTMSKSNISGVAVHAMDDNEYCWVFLASSEGQSRYAELPGDDECYPSKESALVAAYLAFRARIRRGAR